MASGRYKRPISVLVVVYTRDGQVLLLRRCVPDGFWQSVTGSLVPGEHPLDAARRELEEETGLAAPGLLRACGVCHRFPIRAAWRARYAPGVRFNIEHLFCVPLEVPRRVTLNPREHSAYRWVPRGEALDLASSWTDRRAIRSLVPDPGGGP